MSYLFNGSNQWLRATLAGSYQMPITIGVFVRHAAWDADDTCIVNLGNIAPAGVAANSNDSLIIRTRLPSGGSDRIGITRIDATGSSETALASFTEGSYDGAFIPVVGVFLGDSGSPASRSYIGPSGAASGTGSGDSIVGDALKYVSIGAGIGNNKGFTGYIAEVAIWNGTLAPGDVALYCSGISADQIRPDILIGYWPLAGNGVLGNLGTESTATLTATGAVFDSAHPTIMREPTGNHAYARDYRAKGSMVTDASGDFLTRTANLPDDQSFTISGWFKPSGTRSGNWAGLFSLWENSANLSAIGWSNSASPNLKLYTGVTDTEFSAFPDYNEWQYFAITCSGAGATDLKGYWWRQDGVLGGTAQMQPSAFSPTAMKILQDVNWNGTNYSYGSITNLRVWDAALTQAELEAEMRSTLPVRTANLNTSFDYDPRDQHSGNSRNWTVSGITYDSDAPPHLIGSMELSSASEYIQRTANLLDPTTGFSLSGWFRVGTDRAGNYRKLFALSAAFNLVSVGWSNGNAFQLDTFATAYTFSGAAPTDGSWFYLAVSCAGSGANQLLAYWWNEDGTLGGTATGTRSSYSPTHLTILNNQLQIATEYVPGNCNGVRVWDAALTQGEFEREMFSRVPVRKTNLNTSFVGNARDRHSGNARDWSLSGVTYSSLHPPLGGSLVAKDTGDILNRTTSLPTTTAFTMVCWAKRINDLSTSRVVFRLGGSSTRIILRYHQPSGNFMIDNGTDDDSLGSWQALSTGWCYFAMVGSSSGANGLKAYVWDERGALLGSWLTMTGASFTTTDMRVGTNDANSETYGAFCHCRVWDAALTREELEREMLSVVPARLTNLNTAFQDSKKDISGNGRDWSLTGIQWSEDAPTLPADPARRGVATKHLAHQLVR